MADNAIHRRQNGDDIERAIRLMPLRSQISPEVISSWAMPVNFGREQPDSGFLVRIDTGSDAMYVFPLSTHSIANGLYLVTGG